MFSSKSVYSLHRLVYGEEKENVHFHMLQISFSLAHSSFNFELDSEFHSEKHHKNFHLSFFSFKIETIEKTELSESLSLVW